MPPYPFLVMVKRKENAADMAVEDRLKALYQLQTILSEIDRIRILRGELPLEVEDLEDDIEGLKTRISKFENELADINNRIAEYHHKIEEANKLLATYTQQIDNVRNNREYDLLNKEIEFQNLEIELCNKRIREAQVQLRQKEEQLDKCKADLEVRIQDLDVKKNELDEIIAETKADEEKLREKAKSLESNIEPRLLLSFKRIRKNCRNGLGIVYVQRDACGGCFAKIPPQRQLDVRMRKKVIVCEYCGRILVDPELAGVKLDTASEEKPKRRTRRKKEE